MASIKWETFTLFLETAPVHNLDAILRPDNGILRHTRYLVLNHKARFNPQEVNAAFEGIISLILSALPRNGLTSLASHLPFRG